MAQVKAVLPHILLQNHGNQKHVTISTSDAGITITMVDDEFFTTITGDVEDGQFVLTQNRKDPV